MKPLSANSTTANPTTANSAIGSWIFAVLPAIAMSLSAWTPLDARAADPVEDLLLGHASSAASRDTGTSLVEPDKAMHNATIPAVAPQDDTTDWLAAPDQTLQMARDDSADHKSTAAPPVSLVPEPSAWLLALAALVYFMLFGRRRRVV